MRDRLRLGRRDKFHKISPDPSLPKRGEKQRPLWKRGIEGDFKMTSTIYLILLLFSLTLSSCGSGEHSATDTGSASFGLTFEEATAPVAMKLAPSMAPADICSSYGIDSISGTVYNSSNTVIATGGPWPCSAHQGTINNIPPGSNLRIAIKGTVSGTVVWQGETTGATIYAGQDTNVGSISMTYIGNDTTAPTVTFSTPNGANAPVTSPITVTFSETMAASTINTSTFTINGVTGTVIYSDKTATFTPYANLAYWQAYTGTITTDVTDMAGNHIQSPYTLSFSTEAAPGSAPTTPTGVTTTTADKQVTVSWAAVSGATSYNIYWSNTTGVTKTNGTPIAGATSPYIHTALTNGTAYYYVVTAVNSYGETAASSQVSAMPVPPVPSAPTGVSVTAGNTQATISWSAVTGATSYNLYWSTTTGVTTANGTKITGATSPYIHTGRTNETTYYYIVTAVNLGGESTASSQVTATPSALMGGSIQGTSLNLISTNATVTTFAGSASLTGSTDGTGTAARFNGPWGITTDGTNLFVADTANHTIRKIVISTGVVTTIAGSAGIVGTTDGTGTVARFNVPCGIITDGTNLFVADTYNYTIRKVQSLVGGSIQVRPLNLTNTVTTIAGAALSTGTTDGIGTAVRFNRPYGITTPDGINLYIADANNSTIRKMVISTGVVSTIAGSAGVTGSTDATGTAARFNGPTGITTDGTNLFVSDSNNYTIRKIVLSTGDVSTIAGSAGLFGSTNGTGTSARFYNAYDLTTDGTNLYVADTSNHTIRKIVISTGAVTTFAGGVAAGTADGIGSAARFFYPYSLTTDGINLYVTDSGNSTIRTVVISTSVVTTMAGSAGLTGSTDGTGTAARFTWPRGITTDGTNLFVSDTDNATIRKIVIGTGAVTTIAGSAGLVGSTDGTGSAARFNWPAGINTDGTSLFVADDNNHTIRKIQ